MFRLLVFMVSALLFAQCTSAPEVEEQPVVNNPSAPSTPPAPAYSYQVFDVVDSAGVPRGAGYDIYAGQKRFIHQTTIPGEAGTEGFVSRDEAERVAQLVVAKLQSGAGLPGVTIHELDSLHITRKAH